MKLSKCIGLFFVFSLISFGGGVATGIQLENFFYPGESDVTKSASERNIPLPQSTPLVIMDEPVKEVSSRQETLNADTVFVVEERDMDTDTLIKSSSRIPQKYIGMNRERFVDAIADYNINPPLEELERGFVSMELLTFSTQKVEVSMNYRYLKPTNSFYIVLYNNHVTVMLEDKQTVYQETQINITELPYEIQMDIMNGLFVPNEESLYDFLENYTS